MTLVFYISGHGFGHATRDFEVINQIRRQQPTARIVIRSAVPRWFVEQSIDAVEQHRAVTDVGVVQIDSLQLDEHETARQAAAFYGEFAGRVATEVAFLRATGATTVVGDIPPLAFAAAAAAGIRSVALANFTWDWIYEGYPQFAVSAPDVLPIIRTAYRAADVTLRLPFHGGFAGMRQIIDVPLIGRRSRLGRVQTRQRLGLRGERTVVLASFGGHGADLPLTEVARRIDGTLLMTPHEAPAQLPQTDRLRCIPAEEMTRLDLHYEDLVAAADVVVTKPGYGIVSECIANGTALLYTSRGHFVEHDVLVRGMKDVLRSYFLTQDQLRAGHWEAAIAAVLALPPPPHRMEPNGAAVAAEWILRTAGGSG